MTTVKTHLVRMLTSSIQYEEGKFKEAVKSSSLGLQQEHRKRIMLLAEAAISILNWIPTVH